MWQNTDPAQRYIVLKIEGEITGDVAKAKDSLKRILAGAAAMKGDAPLWSASFNNGKVYWKLKQIRQDLGVLVVRDRKKSRLHLYGPFEKCEEARRVPRDIVKTDSSTVHIVELGLNKFWWAFNGGFQCIVFTSERDVVAVDAVSTPNKTLITGSTTDYQTALAIINDRNPEEAKIETGNNKDCAVCWTEAEDFIRTQCNHLYYPEWFDNLYSSGSAARVVWGTAMLFSPP